MSNFSPQEDKQEYHRIYMRVRKAMDAMLARNAKHKVKPNAYELLHKELEGVEMEILDGSYLDCDREVIELGCSMLDEEVYQAYMHGPDPCYLVSMLQCIPLDLALTTTIKEYGDMTNKQPPIRKKAKNERVLEDWNKKMEKLEEELEEMLMSRAGGILKAVPYQ